MNARRTPCQRVPAVPVGSPAELLAAVPYLIGYRPSDSLVSLFFGSGGSVCLSARLDWEVCRADPHQAALAVVERAVRSDPAFVMVAVVDAAVGDPDALDEVVAAYTAAGLEVLWAGWHDGDSWRGPDCDMWGCGEHRIDPTVPAPIVAHLVAQGRAPVADRDAVVAQVARDPVAVVPEVAVPQRPRDVDREAWREYLVAAGMDVLVASMPLQPSDVGVMAAACQDVRVRDVLLWRLTSGPEHLSIGWEQAWQVFADTLRRCPRPLVGHVAAVAAVAAWQLGDGTRANECLNRAWLVDPEHSLAALVRRSLDAGCPPRIWQEVMGGLTEHECRFGSEFGRR